MHCLTILLSNAIFSSSRVFRRVTAKQRISGDTISLWSRTKRQDNWSSQVVSVVDVVPHGIRLRFNEHGNDRGARGVQRGATFVSTCFPRVSFARYCKTGRGRNSFPFWSTCPSFGSAVVVRRSSHRFLSCILLFCGSSL